jgi:hypothetical protein
MLMKPAIAELTPDDGARLALVRAPNSGEPLVEQDLRRRPLVSQLAS